MRKRSLTKNLTSFELAEHNLLQDLIRMTLN